MADTSTTPKRYLHNNLQRIEAADLNAISTVSVDYVDEVVAAIFGNDSGVIDGFHVAHDSGYVFNVYRGTAIWNGRVIKDTQATVKTVTLNENLSSDPRIDVIFINGYSESDATSASKVSLSSYSRTALGSPTSIGAGDDSTKAFDLAHSGVDPRTLKVYKDAAQVGGWVYSQGTGGSGKDQVIFETAPAAGAALTADYTHESGGAEGTSSLYTRKTLIPDIRVSKGTPASSPVANLIVEPSIVLAHVTVPGSWSGGAPTSINNAIKKFLLHADGNVDPACKIPAAPGAIYHARAGRTTQLLRDLDQPYFGGRLRYESSDTIAITPIWGTIGGQSIHSAEDVTLQLQTADSGARGYVDATGWWYVYATQDLTPYPGVAPLLDVSQEPPNSRRREANGNLYTYVGAIYLTAYTPSVVIQPFYTHGDWVYWEDPTGITVDAGTNNIDVSQWCPPTGRLLNTRTAINFTPESAGDSMYVIAKSHKSATSKDWPQYGIGVQPPATATNELAYATGILRAEDDSGTRYVHTTRSNSGGVVESASIWVMGYLEDYRTMDDAAGSSSSPTFY